MKQERISGLLTNLDQPMRAPAAAFVPTVMKSVPSANDSIRQTEYTGQWIHICAWPVAMASAVRRAVLRGNEMLSDAQDGLDRSK